MPAWIPGSYLIRDFSRQLDTLQARCKGKAIAVRKTGNHTWRCAPCRGPLAIDYTVYAWDLSVRGAHFDESHAFFNGTSVFLGVIGQTNEPCHVKLVPPTQARGWKVYTSLPIASGHPDAAKQYGFGVYAAPDYDALIDHPVEMGTPQVLRFKAHGAAHEMVFTGVAPKLDMARIARDVQKICAAQIALFDPVGKQAPFLDSASRYVFMVMVTGDGYGGLEHRASTALMTSRYDLPSLGVEPTEGYQTFLGLVSHEYFHTWNVKRIKPAAFAPYNLSRENHTRLLWVFEGFTSYYDDLMLLRSGVIGENDYLRLLGKTISAVHRGAGRHKQSVAESSFDAWTRYYKQDENSPNVLVSYYTKGSLIALGLDAVLIGSRFDGDAKSSRGLGVDLDGDGATVSLEGGYPFALGQDWTIEPQAQAIWQKLSFDDKRDAFLAVSFDAEDAVTARVGLRLIRSDASARWRPYLKANVWHGFGGSDRIAFGADRIESEQKFDAFEFGGGLVARINDRASFFAAVDYTVDAGDDEERKIFEGNLGLRIAW